MKSIWIVGASTGIGKAVALLYARQGYRVFVSARSQQTLDALVMNNADLQGELLALPMDMTDVSSITQAIAFIKGYETSLDKLIINAGICEYVDDVIVDIELFRRVMDTNVFSAIQISNQSMALLKPKSQLVFVSSSVTYQALPRAHAYGASKAALRYYAECLKMDVQHQGIDVRMISPGFVKTPLTDKNDFDMPFIIDSEEAAKRIVKGLNGKKFDIHFPKRFTLLLKLFSILPDAFKFKVLGKLTRQQDAKTIESLK